MHPERVINADEVVSGLDFNLLGRAADSQRALAYARLCFPDGTDWHQRVLALHLATMFALDDALECGRPLGSAADEQRTLLPWREAPSGVECAQAFASRAPIRAAIAHVERQLASTAYESPHCAPRSADDSWPPHSAMQWWREQGELMVAAVWQEAHWRSSGTLPDEGAYLAVAETSIGIPWIVATLLVLDGTAVAPLLGSTAMAATAALAAAIRLANDLHETRRERREGKVQLLFLRTRALQSLGYPARSAERRARHELQVMLGQRVTRVRALLDDPQWSGSPRLRAGFHGMLSAALALIHMHESAAPRTMAAAAQPRS